MHDEVTETRPGRQRDTSLTTRILDEVWRLFSEEGSSAVEIETVARNIGCGKTSIYRRWEDKSTMLAAAFMHTSEVGEDPDTGSLIEDLIEFSLVNVRNQEGRMSHILLTLNDDEITRTLWEDFYGPRQEIAFTMMRRGIERGELAARADLMALLDLLSGLTLFRNAVRGRTTTRNDLANIVPALVAHPPLLAE